MTENHMEELPPITLDVRGNYVGYVDEDGETKRIDWGTVERIAGDFEQLQAEARIRQERANVAQGLRMLATWIEQSDLDQPLPHGLDDLTIFFSGSDSEGRLRAVAARYGAEVETVVTDHSSHLASLVADFGAVRVCLYSSIRRQPATVPAADGTSWASA